MDYILQNVKQALENGCTASEALALINEQQAKRNIAWQEYLQLKKILRHTTVQTEKYKLMSFISELGRKWDF